MPRIKPRPASDFEVRESTIPGAGRGLFARVAVEPGETIGYYTGEVVGWERLTDQSYSKSKYIFAVGRDRFVVARGPRANHIRYINHATEPNAFAVVSTRWKTVRIEAIRPVKPGDEIFLDYGEDYWT